MHERERAAQRAKTAKDKERKAFISS